MEFKSKTLYGQNSITQNNLRSNLLQYENLEHGVQLPTFAYKRLLNKPYENEVYLTGQSKRKIVASPMIFDIFF